MFSIISFFIVEFAICLMVKIKPKFNVFMTFAQEYTILDDRLFITVYIDILENSRDSDQHP